MMHRIAPILRELLGLFVDDARFALAILAWLTALTGGAAQQITDWRFGRAPSGPVHLLQRRSDPNAVTTDVSLRTLWNRLLLAIALLLFGGVLAIGLAANAMKPDDAADDAQAAAPRRG